MSAVFMVGNGHPDGALVCLLPSLRLEWGSHHHHHPRRSGKSHPSHGQRPGLKRNKSKGKILRVGHYCMEMYHPSSPRSSTVGQLSGVTTDTPYLFILILTGMNAVLLLKLPYIIYARVTSLLLLLLLLLSMYTFLRKCAKALYCNYRHSCSINYICN